MTTEKVNKAVKSVPNFSTSKAKHTKKQAVEEQKYFAKQLSEKIGISRFEFLIIQRKAGIEDNTPITISEITELYKKYIE